MHLKKQAMGKVYVNLSSGGYNHMNNMKGNYNAKHTYG
jgi:hypothetical protein